MDSPELSRAFEMKGKGERKAHQQYRIVRSLFEDGFVS